MDARLRAELAQALRQAAALVQAGHVEVKEIKVENEIAEANAPRPYKTYQPTGYQTVTITLAGNPQAVADIAVAMSHQLLAAMDPQTR